MKALIVDDERLARKELINLLEAHKNIQIVGEATDAEDALEKISKLEPELIFLDIQMPVNGWCDRANKLVINFRIFRHAFDVV